MFAKSFTIPSAWVRLVVVLLAGCKQDLGWAVVWEGARLCCPIATGASEQHGDNQASGEGSNAARTGGSHHQHGLYHSYPEATSKKAPTP